MPRISTGKTKVSVDDKLIRAKKYRVTGYRDFVDPFPLGFGTLPEKIVYAALSRRGIPFYYLNDVRLVFPEIAFDQTYQADFVLPHQKIIIEVQGAHWHSMPATIAADAFKMAVYEQAGYKPLAWWDFEIIADVNRLFLQTPELMGAIQFQTGTVSSELAAQQRTKTDTSQGIRTMNARRGTRLQYRKKAPTVRARKNNKYGGFATYGK